MSGLYDMSKVFSFQGKQFEYIGYNPEETTGAKFRIIYNEDDYDYVSEHSDVGGLAKQLYDSERLSKEMANDLENTLMYEWEHQEMKPVEREKWLTVLSAVNRISVALLLSSGFDMEKVEKVEMNKDGLVKLHEKSGKLFNLHIVNGWHWSGGLIEVDLPKEK